MELSEVFRSLGKKLTHKQSDKDRDIGRIYNPESMTMWEEHSKRMLVNLYTDPELLRSIAHVDRAMAGLRTAEEQLTIFEEGFGFVNRDRLPKLQSYLTSEVATSTHTIALIREQALSIVPADRRPVVEGKALLAAQEILTKKLKEEKLNADYRTGALEMLERIKHHLETDIILTGQNST